MKTLALAALLLAACTDDAPPDCGPAPSAPGWAVSFETINGSPRAVLTVPDYENIAAWRDDIAAWSACVEGRSQ